MNEFDSYKKYNFNLGFSEPADFLRMKDERNKRILMEEQYNLLQIQKAEILAQQKYRNLNRNEILAQQKYRKEQSQSAKFEKWLLIFNTLIAIAALLVSIFK